MSFVWLLLKHPVWTGRMVAFMIKCAQCGVRIHDSELFASEVAELPLLAREYNKLITGMTAATGQRECLEIWERAKRVKGAA